MSAGKFENIFKDQVNEPGMTKACKTFMESFFLTVFFSCEIRGVI